MSDATEHPCQPPEKTSDISSTWVCPHCYAEWWWMHPVLDREGAWVRKEDILPPTI